MDTVDIIVLIVLSIFAFLGMSFSAIHLLSLHKPSYSDKGLRIVLYLPQNFSSELEGIIRLIFVEDIPRKLMSDGRIYIKAPLEDTETKRILEKLGSMYPVEMLPGQLSYCMITEREKNNDLQ